MSSNEAMADLNHLPYEPNLEEVDTLQSVHRDISKAMSHSESHMIENKDVLVSVEPSVDCPHDGKFEKEVDDDNGKLTEISRPLTELSSQDPADTCNAVPGCEMEVMKVSASDADLNTETGSDSGTVSDGTSERPDESTADIATPSNVRF